MKEDALKVRTFLNSSLENSDSKTSEIDRTGSFSTSFLTREIFVTFFCVAVPDGLGPSIIFDASIV